MTTIQDFHKDFNRITEIIFQENEGLIVITDTSKEFKILFVNENQLTKYSSLKLKNIINNSILNLISKDEKSKIVGFLTNLSGKQFRKIETTLIHKKSKLLWCDLSGKIIKIRENKYLYLIFKENTELRKLKAELAETKENLKLIRESFPEIRFWRSLSSEKNEDLVQNTKEMLLNVIDNIPEYICWKDTELRYLGCNENFAKLFNLNLPEEISGKTDRDLISNQKLINNLNEIENKAIKTNSCLSNKNEIWHIGKDKYIFESKRIPLHKLTGKIFGLLCSYRDISNQKKAERKLKQSEEKYRHLFNNTTYGVLLLDLKGRIIDWNLTFEHLLGYKIQKYRYSSFFEFEALPKEKIEFLKKRFQLYTSGNRPDPITIEVFKKDGELVWVNPQVSLVSLGNQTVIQIIFQDITEKKKNEQKLRESEQKFRTITEQAFIGVVILQDYHFKYVSKQFERIFGYSYENFLNWTLKDFYEIVHPEDRENLMKTVLKKYKGMIKEINNLQFRAFKKSGELIWLDVFSKTIIYKGREADLTYVLDITERRQAEEKIIQSENKYRHLFDNSPLSIILIDEQGKYIDCNLGTEKLFGYSKSELLARKFAEFPIISKEKVSLMKKRLDLLFQGIKLEPIEFQGKKKDGTIVWVNSYVSLMNLGSKKFGIILGQDITQDKQFEKRLMESNKRLEELLETSAMGVIEISGKEITYINPKMLKILGFDRSELTYKKLISEIIYPKDIHKFLRFIENKDLEIRIIDNLNRVKWLKGKRVNLRDNDGKHKSKGFRLWLDDITESKLYENTIYELSLNFLNFTTDVQKNIEMLLESCCKLLNGDIALYLHRRDVEGVLRNLLFTSKREMIEYDSDYIFENLLLTEIFKKNHDFPQSITNLKKTKYFKTDPFIHNAKANYCYAKLIKSHNKLDSAICVLFQEEPQFINPNELILFIICDAIEIEERRWKVQKHLEEQNKMLNEINAFKSELLSRTSHELKTPLISVKGFTELLLTLYDSKLDKDMISILEEIKNGSKRLEKTINVLLESSRLEQNKLVLNLQREDLSFLLKYCIKELEGIARLREQSISLDLHDNLYTRFDKERIYEVISNFMTNAIKYTPTGGKIEIKSSIKDNYYIISVKDTGIGITQEEMGQLFKQFGKIERYGKGWDLGIEGTGLGLYISKKIIELHKGEIWAESDGRDKGSTFYFSLPIIKD